MTPARRRLRAPSLLAVALLAGCTFFAPDIVRERTYPAAEELDAPIRVLAVAPFQAGGSATRSRAEGAVGPDEATLVAGQVAAALAERGLDVRPPADLRRALALEDPAHLKLDPESGARAAAGQLGADALLLGEVTRFREREGSAAGSPRPASVSFEVRLYSAPEGKLLWSALFDETQQPFTSNVFKTPRYPGGGTRWLKAEELSRWGAGKVAGSMPFAP